MTRLILLTEDQVRWALPSCFHHAAALPLQDYVFFLDGTPRRSPKCSLLGTPYPPKGSWGLVSDFGVGNLWVSEGWFYDKVALGRFKEL